MFHEDWHQVWAWNQRVGTEDYEEGFRGSVTDEIGGAECGRIWDGSKWRAWAEKENDPPCSDTGGLNRVDEQGAEAPAL